MVNFNESMMCDPTFSIAISDSNKPEALRYGWGTDLNFYEYVANSLDQIWGLGSIGLSEEFDCCSVPKTFETGKMLKRFLGF